MNRFWINTDPRRQATILACLIWLVSFCMETLVAADFAVVALLWSLHGLALMLAMKKLLEHATALSRWPRVIVYIAAPVIFAILQTFIDIQTVIWIGSRWLQEIDVPQGMVLNPLGLEFWLAFRISWRLYLWMFGFYVVILALMGAIRSTYLARLEAQKAELDALRLQVNPHFLFNALNSVSALIVQGRAAEAEAMTLSLARFYRNTLAADDLPLAPLGQELDAVQAYVELEQERLGERLTLTIDGPEDLHSVEIPALLLHPLIENAVKHGMDDDPEAPLPITMTLSRIDGSLSVVVENPVAARVAPVAGAGVGLDNVRRRLNAAYGPRALLETVHHGSRWRIMLRLPIHSQA